MPLYKDNVGGLRFNDENGLIKVVTGTDPAANTEWSQTVTTGKAWKLKGVFATMVQGATQTPWPVLTISDGSAVFMRIHGNTAAQGAGTTVAYNWLDAGVPVASVGGTALTAVAPLPRDLLLPAGFIIASLTGGMGANSDWGAPKFYVVEYTLH